MAKRIQILTADEEEEILHPETDVESVIGLSEVVHPKIVTEQPQDGFVPNIFYNLGELTGNITFSIATPSDATIVNHYYWTFETGSTVPTITWPTGISWYGSAPELSANKHYEISVLNGIGMFMEV